MDDAMDDAMDDEAGGQRGDEQDDGSGGTPVPHTTWLVDYEGGGRYYIRRYSADGSINEIIRPQLLRQIHGDRHEYHASAHATVFASPGDTIVFSPAFALIYAIRMREVLEAILNRCPPRMPRRKHCPDPMWRTEDGIGIMKGGVHPDQHGAFTGALAVNGFNLGLRGLNCAGTKRRWEWVEPEERRGGGAGRSRTEAPTRRGTGMRSGSGRRTTLKRSSQSATKPAASVGSSYCRARASHSAARGPWWRSAPLSLQCESWKIAKSVTTGRLAPLDPATTSPLCRTRHRVREPMYALWMQALPTHTRVGTGNDLTLGEVGNVSG